MFVLMFYLWTANMNAGGVVTFQEFTTKERCEYAGQVGSSKFAGLASKSYWMCVPK